MDSHKVGEHFAFALGHDSTDGPSNNHILLGQVTFEGATVVAEIIEFDGRANKKPTKALVRHVMRAPHRDKRCQDRLMEMPTAAYQRSVRGTWKRQDKTLWIELGEFETEWKADEKVERGFRLSKAWRTRSELPLAVGFAFQSPQPDQRRKLSKLDFAPYYDGDIYHKDNSATAMSPWELKTSGLKISAFREEANPNLLGTTLPGTVRGAWVQNTILLNHDPSNTSKIYQDLGHDFNNNGCYDEHGHNKVMLVAKASGHQAIDQMVYVEYSYTYDGFPMLSVGRYYKKH